MWVSPNQISASPECNTENARAAVKTSARKTYPVFHFGVVVILG